MTHSSPTARIGLVWHSMNSDNLGVGALTLANIVIVENAARRAGVIPKFLVLGWTDPKPHYMIRDDVEVIGLRLKDFVKPSGGLFSQLRRCDLVLDIGAGDSFTDIYGSKRYGTVLGSKLLTFMARRPLILSPQTIGPFNGTLTRRLALAVMQRAYAVTSRDDLSTAFLTEIGYKKPIIQASDVALRLPYDPPAIRNDGITRIGINVSGLLYHGGYTKKNMFGLKTSYADAIRELVGRYSTRPDCELHLVSHVISDFLEVEDDYRASQLIATEFPNVILAPKFMTPVEAKSYISGLDFFAGARMHACIAAFSSGVPVLPMSYSRKFAGMFGSLGYDALVDCQTSSQEEILQAFDAAFENRKALQAQTKVSLAQGLERLSTYEDTIVNALEARKGLVQP